MSVELPFPVSVEIKGVAKVATFAKLPDALDAVRASLARLPLDEDQAGYLADYFSPASAKRIAHQLIHVGAVRVLAFVGIESHLIDLRPAAE
ncbi:hypothetical protein ACIRST_05720 [Kitasatospora sp. NPDC101447]|uniref:hypothetical protein n=1 Tax=Kitasatospora sp. NPDC101447 TaxID=3364102 RepID=UPI0037FD689B